MDRTIKIRNHTIGNGNSVYIVAELSANHNQNFEEAVRLICAAKDAGADAVKVQTYTPDTITIDCDHEYFYIEGKRLYDLYSEAHTPWEWQPKLQTIANSIGMDFFSTPFDSTSVDFLEEMNVPAYKIASFEIVDIPLIEKIASTGKPIIMSTGMASIEEMDEAVSAIRNAGNNQIAILKCNSAYPAIPEEMNIATIPDMITRFGCPVGLSDHTLGYKTAALSVAAGACIIEKHLIMSRELTTPDSRFSMEPMEFKKMVCAIRSVSKLMGKISYAPTEREKPNIAYRRSLFAVEDIAMGGLFDKTNVRSIRPGRGLPPKYLSIVLGKTASESIKRGTPLNWKHINGDNNE